MANITTDLKAKTINLGLFYGMGKIKLRKRIKFIQARSKNFV
jgi:DNA polymerase I-like protein with 3'-5' exonuclease and polymerase domains